MSISRAETVAPPADRDLDTIRKRLPDDAVAVFVEDEASSWVAVHLLSGGRHQFFERVTRFNEMMRPYSTNAWRLLRSTTTALVAANDADEILLQVGARVGTLVESVRLDLANENSALRRELDTAQVEISFLRDQVAALTSALRESQRSNSRSILKAGLAGFAGILLAITTGLAEGVASTVVAPNDEQDQIERLIDECLSLQSDLD